MTKTYLQFLLIITIALLFTNCKKEDPVIPNEEELITTLNYTLTPMAGGAAITLSFKDLDGDGGAAPLITGGTLLANQTYTGTIDLLNEAASPAESITQEVQEEAEDHQFFLQSTIPNVTITYTDRDANGNPIGLNSTLTTGAAASGDITVILRHKPNKSASGVSDGDIANADGETDIQVTFPVEVL